MKIFLLGLLILLCSACKKEPTLINTYEINMSQLEISIDSPEQHRVIIQVEDSYILDTVLNKDYYNFIYRFKTNDAVIFYLNSSPRKIFAYAYIYKNHQLVWEGASKYIADMEGQEFDITKPELYWEEFCEDNRISHEINNNPFN